MRESGDLYEDKEMASNVRRYETMKKTGVPQYFDVDEYLMIVDYYMQRDMQNKAVEACETALKVHGNDPELLLKQAQIQVHQGKVKAAIKAILPLEPLLSDHYEFYLTKASALLQLGKSEDLFIESFQKALELSADVDPEEREDIFMSIGEMLEGGHFYKPALSIYKVAAREFPENIDFLFKIGVCYENLDRFDDSIAAYNRAIDLDPFSESAWYNLGIVYNSIGDYDKAIEAYNFATAIDPTFYDAVFNKGNTCCNAGYYEDGLKCYQEYLKVYPNSVSAQCYLGECLYHLDRLDEAERCFNSIVGMFSDNADAWFGKAMIFSTRREFDLAIDALEKVLHADPEHDSAWHQLGRILAQNNNFEGAIEAYRKSLELNHYEPIAWENLALAYSATDDDQAAIDVLNEGLEYMPDDSILLYVLAAICLLIHRTDECLRHFRKAFRQDPDLCEHFISIVPESAIPSEIMSIIKNQNKDNK